MRGHGEVPMTDDPSLVSVVDDDESVRESPQTLLREFGFSAVVAFSSAEAFLASNVVSYTDCLLLDIAMPGMSGPDLQQELTGQKQRFRRSSSRRMLTLRPARPYSTKGLSSLSPSRSARRRCSTRYEPP